jgi:membrane protease YdiL (CAAX protease family)
VVSPVVRAAGRWLNPTALVLVGICFALPFVTVSCNTPDGFGRAARGGTTQYTGIDLAVGGEPEVNPPDRVRSVAQQQPDKLPPQPAAVVVLALVVTSIGFSLAMSDRRTRRESVALAAAVGAIALLVNQELVQNELAVRVAEQVGPLTDGRTASDLVSPAPGFLVALLLLIVVALGNAIAWWVSIVHSRHADQKARRAADTV